MPTHRANGADRAAGDDCEEVAAAPGAVRVQDSKEPAGPQLALPAHTWAGFVRYHAGGR